MVFVLNVDSLDLIPHTATDFVYRRIILTQFFNGT